MAAGTDGMRASGVTVETDVAVIGAGPVGLFAVFQCGMLRMRCVVVDALDAIGGQCAALYPEKPIFDIPAHPEIEGGALIHKLEAQAAPFTPLYLLGRRVETLRELDGEWQLGTSAGDLRDQPARHPRDRRHRHLSRQAEADPAGLLGSGDGGACHPPPGLPGRGAAFRVQHQQGRPGGVVEPAVPTQRMPDPEK